MNKLLLLLLSAVVLSSANLFAQSPATNSAAGNPAIQPVTRSNPTNWMSRHEGFVEIAKKGGVDLLFLGDSITDGWRNKGKAVWDKSYGSRNAANFGIGGDRTQHVLWRIENGELVGIKPRVVVLMIGTNNSNSDSGDQIAEGVERIIQVLHAKLPATKVLLLAIFPRHRERDTPEQLDRVKQANARIAKLDNGKTVRFLDINAQFLGPDGKIPADVMPDALHPNEKGYGIWAEAMEPALVEMLK